MNRRTEAVHIGTHDWRFPDDRSGFYPEDLPEDWQLEYYATQFHTLELPPLEAPPDPATVADWTEQTLEDAALALPLTGVWAVRLASGGDLAPLARALAPAPQLMLLDEPFSSLDARLRDRIRDDTLHVLKKVGAGVLLVTHDPEEAMFMADRIVLMREGRVVQAGTPLDLYCAPTDPFVVTFFGEVNEIEGRVMDGKVATPVGDVSARGMPEGSRVHVMIRPEALRVVPLDEPPEHHHSHVIMAKLLGRTSLVHICAHAPDGREIHLHARSPGVFLPREGQPIMIGLDASQVFVFPLEPSAAAGAGAAHGDTEQYHRQDAYCHDGQ